VEWWDSDFRHWFRKLAAARWRWRERNDPGRPDRLNQRNQRRRSGSSMEIREKRACRIGEIEFANVRKPYVRATDTSNEMKIRELRSFLMTVSFSTARVNSQKFVELEIAKFLTFYIFARQKFSCIFHKGKRTCRNLSWTAMCDCTWNETRQTYRL